MAAILAVSALTGCAGSQPARSSSEPRTSTASLPSAHPSPIRSKTPRPEATKSAQALIRLLDRVGVTERAPYHPGYDRSCDRGHPCQFGEEWTDKHRGKFGHNGCTTREDVLLAQMADIELRWGSSCRMYEAKLTDPYTAEKMTWRDDGYWIQIDHVYPLAEAWHAGAWDWPQQRRVRFANDVRRELLAVSGRANNDKGSGSLSEWLPPNQTFHCEYVARYLRVAIAYDLTITAADAVTARTISGACP